MAEFTDYLENAIIETMRATNITAAAGYVALFTTATDYAGGGTEVTGGSYARQLAGLSVAAGGASSNAADITFPTATADWGTVTHVALYDAVTVGNMLMHSILDASKTVNDGDIFKINTGDLDVTVA